MLQFSESYPLFQASHDKMTYVKLTYETDVDSTESESLPERVLLAAILERAYRDLFPNVPLKERFDAIRWFTDPPDTEICTSFKSVADMLQLTPSQSKAIADQLKLAQEYQVYIGRIHDQQPSEGEESRARRSALAKREWCAERQTLPAISRRKRLCGYLR